MPAGALEACPDDEDTREMIGYCEERIALPQFAECFRELTVNWWETFAEQEAELRRMMDEDKEHLRGAEIAAQMEEVLHLVFDDISFEIGCNGEKHELILTPEGDKVKLFQLAYFRSHAPEKVLQHWNILVGRQPNPDISLRTDLGWEVSGGGRDCPPPAGAQPQSTTTRRAAERRIYKPFIPSTNLSLL